MKKNYYFIVAFAIGALAMSFQNSSTGKTSVYKKSHFFSSGGPAGRTGAPGEGNCTGCHAGTTQSGATENAFALTQNGAVVTNYIPGETYQVGIAMTSMPAKKGFQATVLTSSNQFAGTFAVLAGGGVALSSASGKTYANHTGASTSAATLLWFWQWTAPATDLGPLRFYVSTNKANGNNGDSGDQIYLSNHGVGSTLSLDEKKLETIQDFTASFSPSNSTVYFKYTSLIPGENFINIVDNSGRTVLNMELGSTTIGENKEMVRIPDHIKEGMYFVQFFVNNMSISKSIVVSRQ